MANRIGFVEIDASGADSGTQAITVPAAADLAVAHYHYWEGAETAGAPAFDINSVGFTSSAHVDSTADVVAVGSQRLANPATGAQTFAWNWGGAGGARSEGGNIIVAFYEDSDTADPIRATDSDRATGGNGVSATVTSVLSDEVMASCQRFTGGNPAIDGTTFVNNSTVNSEVYDASDVTAGASSTTVNMTNENYSSIIADSIRDVPAGTTESLNAATWAVFTGPPLTDIQDVNEAVLAAAWATFAGQLLTDVQDVDEALTAGVWAGFQGRTLTESGGGGSPPSTMHCTFPRRCGVVLPS